MAKMVKCPVCKSDMGYAAVVPLYIWKRPGKSDVTVNEARIVRCSICGEVPADDKEQQRWQHLAHKEDLTQIGSNEAQCDGCGKPQSKTGRFYVYGYDFDPDQKKYCNDCNERKSSL